MGTPDNKDKSRDRYYQRTYGITLRQYKTLLKKQNSVCAICNRPPTTRNLAVDHNHITKEIRGLLCSYCNHRIVGRHRDPGLLRRTADYLEQHTGWFVPDKKKKKRKK